MEVKNTWEPLRWFPHSLNLSRNTPINLQNLGTISPMVLQTHTWSIGSSSSSIMAHAKLIAITLRPT